MECVSFNRMLCRTHVCYRGKYVFMDNVCSFAIMKYTCIPSIEFPGSEICIKCIIIHVTMAGTRWKDRATHNDIVREKARTKQGRLIKYQEFYVMPVHISKAITRTSFVISSLALCENVTKGYLEILCSKIMFVINGM